MPPANPHVGRNMHYDFSIGSHRVDECDVEGPQRSAGSKASTPGHYLDLVEADADRRLSGRLLEGACGHGDFFARAAARGHPWGAA